MTDTAERLYELVCRASDPSSLIRVRACDLLEVLNQAREAQHNGNELVTYTGVVEEVTRRRMASRQILVRYQP